MYTNNQIVQNMVKFIYTKVIVRKNEIGLHVNH